MTAEALIAQINQRQLARDYAGAEAACRKMIAEHPKDPRAYELLGVIRHRVNDIDEAIALQQQAVDLDPQNFAKRHNFGNLLAAGGRFEPAREEFRATLSLNAEFAPAYYQLAQICPRADAEKLLVEIKDFKAARALSRSYLGAIGFALGKLYDGLGEWDRAFDNYDEGNRLLRPPHSPAETRAVIQATKNAFDPETVNRLRDARGLGESNVFIVGMPRSGTSLAEDLLSRIPGVVGLGERDELSYIVDEIARKHGGYPTGMADLSRETLAAYGEKYVAQIAALAPGAQILIDKNPLQYEMLGLLRLMLPEATIIHMRRDPIDTCLSCYFQLFSNGCAFSFDLTHMAQEYAAYADLMRHWNELLPGEIIIADYEKLIKDRDSMLATLTDAIGADVNDADFETAGKRNIATASVWQARQPVHTRSIARWRNYEKHLGPLFGALEATGFDYSPGH